LEEVIPPEVARLDKVSSMVKAPRNIPDINTLLHVSQASTRREHNTIRYIILLVAFGTTVILILCYFFLRPLLCRTLATCREKRNTSKRTTPEQVTNCPPPSSRPHAEISSTESSTGPVGKFTTYPLRAE
jgi:hypothetical protein